MNLLIKVITNKKYMYCCYKRAVYNGNLDKYIFFFLKYLKILFEIII